MPWQYTLEHKTKPAFQAVPTGGVVSNRVTFHCPASDTDAIFCASQESLSTLSGLYTSSDIAGILLKLTEFTQETSVTATVALRRGSSQHGNALRAAVGYDSSVSIFDGT